MSHGESAVHEIPAQAAVVEAPEVVAAPETAAGRDASGAGLLRPGLRTSDLPREIGGREGPEPTRFGDWEKAGRCIDF